MSDKLDRFTKHARRALALSQEEAMRLSHNYIGTEHLLLGLVREENGIAMRALRDLGVEPGQVIRAVERVAGRGKFPPMSKPTLAPRTKRAIELAVDEARLMGHHYIGSAHLLLGVVHEGEGVAVNVLRELGISLDRLRALVLQQIRQGSAQEPPTQWIPAQESQVLRRAVDDPTIYDLTAAAAKGKLEPLIGRQAEIERMIQMLGRRTQKNPLLIGEPGVGKRTLVKGLAQRIVEGQVPAWLLNRRLLVVDVATLITNALYRDLVEQRVRNLFLEGSSGSLFFIDNVHRLVDAVGTSVLTSTMLKSGVSRGEVQLIGATTPSHYAKFLESDAEREWNFLPLEIKEPSPQETLEVLNGLKSFYEAHHQLLITDEALDASAYLAARYLPERYLPGKALDLLDETCSRVRIEKSSEAAPDPQMTRLQVTMEKIAEVIAQAKGLSAERVIEEERARRKGE